MASLSKESIELINRFGRQPGVEPEQAAALETIICSSDVLARLLNLAVSIGCIKHISLLPQGAHAGGQYVSSDDSIRIELGALKRPYDAIFLLGHEIQHSLNKSSLEEAIERFRISVSSISRSTLPVHDYTEAIDGLISAHRYDEAKAEIAGWNALVASVREKNPSAELSDVYVAAPYRAADFVDFSGEHPRNYSYTPKSNITLNTDLSLEATKPNIEAMGKNFFDAPELAKIGDLGKSNYATYYGVEALEFCIAQERANAKLFGEKPKMRVDLDRLGLSEKLLEEEGLNLGRSKVPQPYYDTDLSPAGLRYFDHTQGGRYDHQYVPQAAHLPDADPQASLIDRFIDALERDDKVALSLARAMYINSEDGQQLIQDSMAHAQERKAEAAAYIRFRDLSANPDGPSLGTLTGRRDPRDWDHPDHALYSAIRRELPPQVSDEAAAHVMLQAKQAGIVEPRDLDGVEVRNDRAFVAGKHLQAAHADLSQDPPPMREIVRQSELLDQQMAQDRAQWLAQQQELARSGPSISR
ncbi:hypothetical protein FCE95_06420 [Luteimonas gilva]|uniref:Uncharacterized protein n=1 Tax=Luteimonas gilva TaxID=2572684 RepID=A0A4U5JYS6_9GAMM|nr:hypothetical protein [Luteimonas gilva]TKR33901.1 hypothetical protein FCE95_06420 [Luteimonas gilva]